MSKRKKNRPEQPAHSSPQPLPSAPLPPSTGTDKNLTPAPPAPPALPPAAENELSRIRAEEAEKCQVKEKFEQGSGWKYFFWCVNKPLSIFFLSAVVLGLVSFFYQKWDAFQRKEEQNRERRQRIAVELAYRIEKAGGADKVINARAHLDGLYIEPVFPDSRNRSLRSLLIELGYLLPSENAREQLKRLVEDWEQLALEKELEKKHFDRIGKRINDAIQPFLQ